MAGVPDLRLVMIDHAPVGVAAMALDGHVLATNPELTAFLDLGDLLVEPRPFTDFVHTDDLPEVLERYTRLLRGEPDIQRMDVRLVRPDGVIVWVRIVAALVRAADGAPSHVVVVVQDDPDRLWSAGGSVREQLSRLPGASVTEAWLRRAFADGITRVGICALDLDGFGALVDAHGAAVGDRLLLAVARRAAVRRRARTSPPAQAATSSPCSSPTPTTSPLSAGSPTACRARWRCRSPSTGRTSSSRRASAWPRAPPRTAARWSCCGPQTSPGRGPRPSAAGAG